MGVVGGGEAGGRVGSRLGLSTVLLVTRFPPFPLVCAQTLYLVLFYSHAGVSACLRCKRACAHMLLKDGHCHVCDREAPLPPIRCAPVCVGHGLHDIAAQFVLSTLSSGSLTHFLSAPNNGEL